MDYSRQNSRAARPAPIEVVTNQLEDASVFNKVAATSPSQLSTRSASSEYSPSTPSFSTATTPQWSGSNSSIASSPLPFDHNDVHSSFSFVKRSAPALPDVQEHPLELDEDSSDARMSFEQVESPGAFATPQRSEPWPYGDVSPTCAAPCSPAIESHFNVWDGYSNLMDFRCEPSPKRRRANEESTDSVASRFFDKLPSLVKHKMRKSSPALQSEANSAAASPNAGRSRSNSRAGTALSIFRKSDAMDTDVEQQKDVATSERFETINEVEDADDQQGTRLNFPDHRRNVNEQPEDLERVHTPLLPMLIDDGAPKEVDDKVAFEQVEIVDSVIGDCGHDSFSSIQHTPQLSAKASTNFAQPSLSKAVNDDDDQDISGINMSILSAPEDEWSEKLGHADFAIRPKPYSPKQISAESCSTLLMDWQKARAEYSKHLTRTTKHFGHGSKTYRLTEEKWASIDALWKENYNMMRSKAAMYGVAPPDSPAEPAPVVKIPSLDDKFPQLADAGVVGAMERVEPPQRAFTQIKRDSSVKSGFKKFMDGLNKRSRSASGPR